MKPGRIYWKSEYDPRNDWWVVSAQVLTLGGEWLYVFSLFSEGQKADLPLAARTLDDMQRSLTARANPYLESNNG